MAGVVRWVVGAAALALLAGCGCGSGIETQPIQNAVVVESAMGETEEAFAKAVLGLVNGERSAAGLAPLAWSDAAAEAAFLHCAEMEQFGFYSPLSPDGSTPCDRLSSTGVQVSHCGGEAMALGPEDPPAVMQDWRLSPVSMSRLLGAECTHAGVGVLVGTRGTWCVLDCFSPAIP